MYWHTLDPRRSRLVPPLVGLAVRARGCQGQVSFRGQLDRLTVGGRTRRLDGYL